MSASLCQVDTRQFSARIEELHDALIGKGRAGDAATVFEDEARKFLETVIKVTPPKNRAQGNQAVKDDMYNIFTPVAEDFLNDIGIKYGVSGINEWITSEPSGKRTNIKWDRLDPSGTGMRQFHLENRNAKGRTKNISPWPNTQGNQWYAPYVVSKQDFDSYTATVQKDVGLRKAAWGKSLLALSGKLSAWLSPLTTRSQGDFKGTDQGEKPYVQMTNSSPGILDDQRVVAYALKSRQRSIATRMKLLLSDYAGDFKNNRRIARKARKSYPETV